MRWREGQKECEASISFLSDGPKSRASSDWQLSHFPTLIQAGLPALGTEPSMCVSPLLGYSPGKVFTDAGCSSWMILLPFYIYISFNFVSLWRGWCLHANAGALGG